MTVVNTNLASLNAQYSMNKLNNDLETAMERLSSGLRINSAADDAAGLAIVNRMEAQVRGLQVAIKNANDGISLTQTAEGAMQEVSNILQRMRELSLQAANDANNDTDRAYLQAEVAQLSEEIDRIAGTTQFNSRNVLDGSYSDMQFQIGSNAGQTVGIGIGSMASSALGVATSSVTSSVSSSSTTTVIEGVSATGSAASATILELAFPDDGELDLIITDSLNGQTATISGLSVELDNAPKMETFLSTVQKTLAETAVDTSVTGNGASFTTSASAGTTGLDFTDSDNYDALKFAIQIGDAPVKNINLLTRIVDTGTIASVTIKEVAEAMEAELQALFDDSIEVSGASSATTWAADGQFVIEDKKGRAITVTQGNGNGFLFGTDAQNAEDSVSVSTVASTPNGISAELDGNVLRLTHTQGGKISLSGFDYQNTEKGATTEYATLNVLNDDYALQRDPIILANAAISPSATAKGISDPTTIQVQLSDTFNDGSAAAYTFNVTDGAGNDIVQVSAVDFHESIDNDTILTALRGGVQAGYEDIEIDYDNGVITITSTDGRHMSVDSYSSSVGTASFRDVTTGESEILASQDSYFSSVRLKLGQMIGGGAPGSNVTINIDLIDFGTNVSMSLAFTSAHLASGTAFAAELEAKLQSAVSAMSIIVDGNSVGGTHIGSTFTVDYLSETNEILIRDSGGRAFHFGVDNGSNFAVSNAIFDGAFNGNASANTAEINQTAEIVAKGEVTDQTRATLAFNQDNATGINFSLDGVALSAATDFVFGVDTFVGSTLESRLDALMEDLNATENGEPYAYVFDAATRSITFIQKDAREIEISGFVSTEDTLAASWTPHAGQGAATTLNYVEATTSASAEGLGATATEVTMTLGGDDLYSMVISNGSSDYTLSATVLDISDATSRSNFQSALETALTGSGISVAINSIGALSFTDASGGEISLKSFGSVNGNTGTWTPASGQGDAYVADGSGSINSSTTVTASSSSSSSSGSSVDQINIATQEGAQAAIDVIDAAIAYILAERSGLGAIENRLGHTIDNLSNIVVNTEAAKSRILDADFSAETSQLTKLQILQQAATAMLAQANQSKQSVLSLLQG